MSIPAFEKIGVASEGFTSTAKKVAEEASGGFQYLNSQYFNRIQGVKESIRGLANVIIKQNEEEKEEEKGKQFTAPNNGPLLDVEKKSGINEVR